jgi:hypothetical protein
MPKYERVLIFDDGRVQINRRFHRQPTHASMRRLLDVLGTTSYYAIIFNVDRGALESTTDYEDDILDREFHAHGG